MFENFEEGDSSSLGRRKGRRAERRDFRVLLRWKNLDMFLATVDIMLDEAGWSSTGPTQIPDIMSFAWNITVLGSEWTQRLVSPISSDALWFVVAAYLEARRAPARRWGALSYEEASYLRIMFHLEAFRSDFTPVSSGENVLLFLRARRDWGPEWYRPIPEA